MPAAKFNLTKQYRIEQGSTYSISFLVKDSDGAVYDMSSGTAAAKIRETTDSSTSYSFTCDINTTLGKITASMTAAETALIIAFEDGVWDLELTEADASIHRLLEGDVFVSREVTKT